MAALEEFPVGSVLEFVRTIVDRCWDRRGGLYREVSIILCVEEARLLWAASKWMEVLQLAEVKSKGSFEFTLAELQWMITEKVNEMKAQGGCDVILGLTQCEMKMMMDIETHLDRYVSRANTPAAKKWPNSKKGKKN